MSIIKIGNVKELKYDLPFPSYEFVCKRIFQPFAQQLAQSTFFNCNKIINISETQKKKYFNDINKAYSNALYRTIFGCFDTVRVFTTGHRFAEVKPIVDCIVIPAFIASERINRTNQRGRFKNSDLLRAISDAVDAYAGVCDMRTLIDRCFRRETVSSSLYARLYLVKKNNMVNVYFRDSSSSITWDADTAKWTEILKRTCNSLMKTELNMSLNDFFTELKYKGCKLTQVLLISKERFVRNSITM